uniref:Auxin-induced protein 10A5 n=1 Tax=Anthurium amnicola TaxID=1678845 RepID=A0A1D1XY52_9ARAE
MKKEKQEEKRMKLKKGCLTVSVGLDNEDGGLRRFTIPISFLHHPQFKALLEAAQEVYGYNSSGPLKLPCSVDDFLHLRWLIERESQNCNNPHHHNHSSSFSFHHC